MKKKVFIFFIVCMLLPLYQLNLAYIVPSTDVRQSNQSYVFQEISENITNLSMENITGGIGVTITLRNNGATPLNTIQVSVSITNDSFVRLKNTIYTIPYLAIDDTTELHVHLFGIGLGILTPLPELTLMVKINESIQKEVRITTKVFGFLTKIISIFFTNEAYNGYTLFSPEYSTKTFLIDKQGTIAHIWDCESIQGLGLLLLENGNLLRTAYLDNPKFIAGGVTGGVELFDWNGTKLWQYNYSNTMHCLHHGIKVLPNGHVLLVGWEYKSVEEAIAAGRNPDSLPIGELWPDHVIEVERTGSSGGTIVWEWHVWNHLIQDFDPTKENYGIVQQHPELIDINYGIEDAGKLRADWNHINSIDYNEQFDQILLSVRHQHEIWVIDHSTTTEEAAGHTGGNSGKGGDLLFRWGNPEIYRAGNNTDQRLFGQHDAQWIPAGHPGEEHLLLFNNGQERPEGQFSSIEELIPPVDENGSYYLQPGSAYEPEEPIWSYTAENPYDFYAGYLSSVQRLHNGNTLICDGDHGLFFEVTAEKKTVWKYYNTLPTPLINQVFKILCYAPDYPGLQNLT